jgi:hypothetical protein
VPVSVAVGEAWAVAFGFPNGSSLNVSFNSTALLEPGSQSLSDAINSVSVSNPSTGPVVLTYRLFSDNDLGQIGTTCDMCQLLTEDGTFQQLTGNSFTTSVLGTL